MYLTRIIFCTCLWRQLEEIRVAGQVVVETTRPAKKRMQKLTAETELRQKTVFLVNRLLLLVSWRAFSYGRHSLAGQTFPFLTILDRHCSVGRGTTRTTREKGRSGDYGQVFVNTAKILAAPIKLQLSRELQ